MSTIAAELLPHNREMEMALLGSFFLEPPLLDRISELESGDFYLAANAALFAVMRSLWDRGEPVDYVTVTEEIEATGKSEVVPDVYVHDIIAAHFTSIYALHYAVKIKRYAILRKYILMAKELARQAYDQHDPDDLYAWLHEQLQTIHLGEKSSDAILMWGESFAVYEQILAERKRQAALLPHERVDWSWPWRSWNDLIDPLEPGMLTLIAGGESQGKTVYAECIAEHWARRGHKVVFVHFELNRRLMLDRRASRNTGFSTSVLKSGRLTEEQEERLSEVHWQMQQWQGNITYLHTPGWSMEQVIRETKRLKDSGLCDALIVDYLEKAEISHVQLRRFREDSYRREAHDVEQLKSFSEATETRLVMLAQFSKGGKQTSFNDLDGTGVRGAGEKIEKSNVALLIHRERVSNGERDSAGREMIKPGGYSREVKLRVQKNTMGSNGTIRQYFKGETFQVFDYE